MSNPVFHNLSIKKKRNLTTDSVEITFDIPGNLSDDFEFRAGQYLTVELEIDGQKERRAYSICSSPINKDQGVSIGVKKVQGGKVSPYLVEKAKEGDSLNVMTPEGHFTCKMDIKERKTYYFFGAGSGITPLLSIIQTLLEEEPKSELFLLYGNREESQIMFKAELDEMARKYKGQFSYVNTLSQPKVVKETGVLSMFKKAKSDWKGKIGRIEKKNTQQFLEDHPAIKSETATYFMCGPLQMMDNIEAVLAEKSVTGKQIKKELFFAPEDGKTDVKGSKGKSIVHLDGERFEIEIKENETILEALLREKYQPPFSCTAGVCSTCLAKLKFGTVEMESCFSLEDDEKEAGYILTCQAKLTCPSVEIEYE